MNLEKAQQVSEVNVSKMIRNAFVPCSEFTVYCSLVLDGFLLALVILKKQQQQKTLGVDKGEELTCA